VVADTDFEGNEVGLGWAQELRGCGRRGRQGKEIVVNSVVLLELSARGSRGHFGLMILLIIFKTGDKAFERAIFGDAADIFDDDVASADTNFGPKKVDHEIRVSVKRHGDGGAL
jgi:hypothetical protein